MIKSMKQAVMVQTRRVNAGKTGHARSVRRYFSKLTMDPGTGKPEWHAMNDLKQSVPYIDPFPLPQNDDLAEENENV